MKHLSTFAAAVLAATTIAVSAASAQSDDDPVSQCLAVAQTMPNVIYASASASPLAIEDDVAITFSGHSTYRIESPRGVVAATDFSGYYGTQPTLPRIVTMNQAHSGHYTMNPDPAIEHVLHGWNLNSPGPVDHDLIVEDVYVRNVTTDIRSYSGGMTAHGNSIFIFEIAGLCIGHLGHLHHPLTDDHFAQIGRLDILMVPVDGGLTLSHERMAVLTKRLRSSIVLPMHLRGSVINAFTERMSADWDIQYLENDTITVNVRNLPKRPTVMVPNSLFSRG